MKKMPDQNLDRAEGGWSRPSCSGGSRSKVVLQQRVPRSTVQRDRTGGGIARHGAIRVRMRICLTEMTRKGIPGTKVRRLSKSARIYYRIEALWVFFEGGNQGSKQDSKNLQCKRPVPDSAELLRTGRFRRVRPAHRPRRTAKARRRRIRGRHGQSFEICRMILQALWPRQLPWCGPRRGLRSRIADCTGAMKWTARFSKEPAESGSSHSAFKQRMAN